MGHGGKRPGSGRKPIAKNIFQCTVKFPLEWKARMGENIAKFVRAAVREKIDREDQHA